MCGILANRTKTIIDILLNEITDAPASFGSWDGCGFDPAAIGIFKEVGGGADGGIEIRNEEIRSGLLFASASASLADFTGRSLDATNNNGERATKAIGVKSLAVSNGMLFLIAGLMVKVDDTRSRV